MSNELLAALAPPQPPYVPIHWIGASLTRYEFQLDKIGTIYRPISGVYIFCRQRFGTEYWDPIYVGETDSFYRRLSDQLRFHHCWDGIRLYGASHISTLLVSGNLAAREGIETDLRRQLNAPLNKQ